MAVFLREVAIKCALCACGFLDVAFTPRACPIGTWVPGLLEAKPAKSSNLA